MTLPVLTLVPQIAGYQPEVYPATLRAAFGGLGRYRTIPQQSPSVNVQWQLSGDEFERFMVFYNITIERGLSPFQIDLILDSPHPTTKVVYITPGSLSIAPISSDTHNVAANLRIKQ